MRKIIVLQFMTLDGVVQAPGGPDEDASGNFQFGGWSAGYYDETSNRKMSKQMQPTDYLLGRRTYEIFANYWPKHTEVWPGIHNGTKYVVSSTMDRSDWQRTKFLKTVDDIKRLKVSDGADLQVHGSGNLIQTLLKHDLVDELWLKTFPLTLGSGKKLFGDGTIPAAFSLTSSVVTPSGVIFANYKRAGDVRTGTVGE